MPDVIYSPPAFRELAALPAAARERVRQAVRALAGRAQSGRDGAVHAGDGHFTPLPGGTADGLARARIAGVGHLVCRIGADQVAILHIAAGDAGGSRHETGMQPGTPEPAAEPVALTLHGPKQAQAQDQAG